MPRPKEFDPEKALQRAMETFWEKGYDATSLRDLEERMGINRFSLYSTFESKHELFLRCLDRYRDTVVADEWVRPLESADATLPAIRAHFQRFVDGAGTRAASTGCLMTNSAVEVGPRDAAAARKIRAHMLRLEKAFYDSLSRAVERGELAGSRDLRALARHLTASAQGLAVLSKVVRDRCFLQDVVESTLRDLR